MLRRKPTECDKKVIFKYCDAIQGIMQKVQDKKDLEALLVNKVQPAVDAIMHKFMGVRIAELGEDITKKVAMNPLLGLDVNSLLPFNEARKKFRSEYIRRLLVKEYGNVSEVARIAAMERRSIHRFIIAAKIDIAKIRSDMMKPHYIAQEAVARAVRESLQEFEGILHPHALERIYEGIPEISRELLAELPQSQVTFKEAEEAFERAYFAKLLAEERDTKRIARRSKLRYETVHRKLKKLGLLKPSRT
jgi:DNA-binding NtrC family response regulator